jgi:hypothetical protein
MKNGKLLSATLLSPMCAALVGLPVPSDDFVISQYADGRIASRYGDLAWNWTPYSPVGEEQFLNLSFWEKRPLTHHQSDLLAEVRWLMFSLISHESKSGASYLALSKCLAVLSRLAYHGDEIGSSIQSLLSDTSALWTFIQKSAAYIVRHLAVILRKLKRIGTKVTGYIIPGDTFLQAIDKIAIHYLRSLKQTPPLPTRIYAHVVSVLSEELSQFQSVSEQFLALSRACCLNDLLGRDHMTQGAKRGNYKNEFSFEDEMPVLVEKFGLTEYFRETGLSPSVVQLSKRLHRILGAARLSIQAFTGMRDKEASMLKYGCLEERQLHGRLTYIVHGTTTKLNHGRPKLTQWITNKDGAIAIRVAQQVTELIYEIITLNNKNVRLTLEKIPLLLSVRHLGLGGGRSLRKSEKIFGGESQINKVPDLRERLQLRISEEDLVELEQIDPHRAWRTEPKFLLGIPWTLTSHQLRRSLALYAQRSGLVSLQSLRRQLQHITEAMSRYYAKGSAFAENFIGNNKKHFAHEWRKTQSFSSAISYIKHVVLSSDVLFGGHGNWIENRLRGEDGGIALDRELTLKRFEKGEIAYQENNLGGCTKVGPCDKRPIRWLNIDCLRGCRHLVGRLRDLERAIVAQEKLVMSLDPASRGYQSEKADLDVLIATRDRVRQQAAKRVAR